MAGSSPEASRTSSQEPGLRLRDLSETDLLARIVPLFRSAPGVLVGPGDDAAVVASGHSVVATTDSMVRGRDWRDDWSSGADVGRKVVAQNLADVAAMGAVPTALLVSFAADPDTEVAWVLDVTGGLAAAAGEAEVAVVGGDLSSAPAGVVVVSVTALGDLQGRSPVLRSGARVGDVVAVCGSLGFSGGGLALYAAGTPVPPSSPAGGVPAANNASPAGAGLGEREERDAAVATLMWAHRTAGRPPRRAGVAAADAGASALIDVSDGLVRDAGRIAAASGVSVALSGQLLREGFAAGPLTLALGEEEAMRQVLSGGEEHSLVGCFPRPAWERLRAAAPAPGEPGWRRIGEVVSRADGEGVLVTVDGQVPSVTGWDHFAG